MLNKRDRSPNMRRPNIKRNAEFIWHFIVVGPFWSSLQAYRDFSVRLKRTGIFLYVQNPPGSFLYVQKNTGSFLYVRHFRQIQTICIDVLR